MVNPRSLTNVAGCVERAKGAIESFLLKLLFSLFDIGGVVLLSSVYLGVEFASNDSL